jgi:hypothetical protein
MILENFISVPEAATVAGAPIDAFQANAFRQNDALFEKIVQALMCSPFMPSAATALADSSDVTVNNNNFALKFLNAKTISVTTTCIATQRVPIIWIARERITISELIDASGMGADGGQTGDFGGSGGGGTAVGPACFMPLSAKAEADRIMLGGAAGGIGNNLVDSWQLSRALLHLPWLVGGAGGANAGGKGGGVVCLCAPIIELRGNGKIDVSGQKATGVNTGGGGGGLVILIARQILNANEGSTILINGGSHAASGSGAGGNGKFIRHEFK